MGVIYSLNSKDIDLKRPKPNIGTIILAEMEAIIQVLVHLTSTNEV